MCGKIIQLKGNEDEKDKINLENVKEELKELDILISNALSTSPPKNSGEKYLKEQKKK